MLWALAVVLWSVEYGPNGRGSSKRGALLSTIVGSLSLLSRRQRGAVALLALATLFVNSLDIVAISLMGLVGALALGQGSVENLPWLKSLDQETLIISVLLIAAGVFTLKTVTGVGLARVRQFFLAKLEIHFSEIIASNIFLSDLSTVKQYSRSQLEWTILRSTQLAFGAIIGQALSLLAEVSLTLFILALFFFTDWVSALLVLVYFAVVLSLFQLVNHKKVGRTGSDFAEGSISVGQAISDVLASFKESTVLSRIPYFLEQLSEARAVAARAMAVQKYIQALPRLVVELALIVGAIAFAAFQFATTDGSPDLALISIFIVGSLRMMSSLLPLYRAYMQLRYDQPQASASQALVRAAQNAPSPFPTVPKYGQVTTAELVQNMSGGLEVALEDVTFRYPDRNDATAAIDGMSFRISPGSTVAIIGPSGAGKSTLVDLVLGLHIPTSGQVLCGGLNPRNLREDFPGLMSYVPQKPGLVSGSLRENIALGIHGDKVDEEALSAAIRAAQIEDFILGLPAGIHTPIGKQTDGLSGGQIQRIGLARALYTRPRLLVLDEATSALDAETEASVTASLSALGKQTTTLVVAHRLSTVQYADIVLVIDNGKLLASGKLRDLEREVPLVKKYVALMTLDL